jgi:tRNA-uridine 2-sulfurtransferase
MQTKAYMNENKYKKVFVALSGGVDSSAAAALLKERGFDVTGVFIKVWQPDFLPCRWREDRIDAMSVCAKLEIPFLTFDLEKEYKKEIIDYMISEYRGGRTPNPDIMCNKQIKFGVFLKKALEMGADFIATGHYARLCREFSILNSQFSNTNTIKLLTGADKNKDQSYFLWTLTQEQLKYSLFPTGEYTKPEVRKIARKFSLPTADKKDSQGLCFVGKLNMHGFLKHYIPEKRGNVLNKKGEVLGYHDGAMFFTIGQRHGFVITKKTTHDTPYYVISKDISKNTLTVQMRTDADRTQKKVRVSQRAVSIGQRLLKIKDVNWISGQVPDIGKKYQARIRYRQKLQSCKITWESDSQVVVKFDEAQNTAATGQSLVLYDGEKCLGGGIMEV